MGVIIRQSVKNSIVSYAGAAIGMFNVLWLTPKYLTKEEIGLTRFMLDMALLLAQFAQLGTSHLAVRFFTYFQDETQKYKGFLGFLLLLPFIGLSILIPLYIFFQPVFSDIYTKESPELLQYYFYFLPLIIFLVYIGVLEAYTRVHLRIVVPALIREVFLKLANVLLILLYGLCIIDFHWLVILFIASYGIAVILLTIYVKKLGRLYLVWDFGFIRTPLFKQMIIYSFFVLLGGAGTLLASKIDTLMVAAYKGGLNLTGVYALAFNIAMVIEIPRRAITQISTPLVADAWRRNDLLQIASLYKKSSINQLIAGAFLFLGVWCNIDSIFDLIPNGDTFRIGKWVVFVIAMSRVTDMANGINSEIVVNSKYYRFDLFTMVLLAFLTIFLNSILIPRYQIVGAAMGTFISVASYNIIRTVFLWITFRMQPFTVKTAITIGISLLTFWIVSFLPRYSNSFGAIVLTIAVRSIIITILYLSLIYITGVSEELNSLAQQLTKRIGWSGNK
ncbi:oligosaccharide flippase family protein [Xanthocytophaga agilis]|uniref:Oligosaccharide flippase family protein n=1 Tax=Xanthocytophaga agilis TaxID=3048010 RepID=A0AAE3RAU8_9BACT|nr:oligosaccharide flippase family protein [Xanthocytophaga agilis]MDJ1504700.1 oligosaccharide flippase family protein [Xanthocytophaga agilis]